MEATPLQGGLLFSLEDYASFPNAKGRKIRVALPHPGARMQTNVEKTAEKRAGENKNDPAITVCPIPTRSKRQAMWRGSLGKCPACGSGGCLHVI